MRTQLIPWPSVLDGDGSVATARRPSGSSDIGEFAPYSGRYGYGLLVAVRQGCRSWRRAAVVSFRLWAQIKAGLLFAHLAARRASGC